MLDIPHHEEGSPTTEMCPPAANPDHAAGLDQRHEPPPVIADLLPPWASEFCHLHHDRLAIPTDMMATALLGAQSGFMAGHLVGQLGTQTIPANLFIMQVGTSGSGKSRSHDAVIRPVMELQKRAVKNAEVRWDRQTRPAILQLEARISHAKRELAGAPEAHQIATDIAALEREWETLRGEIPERCRSVIDDTTVAAREQAISLAHRNAVFLVTPDGRPHLEALISSKGRTGQSEINTYLRGHSGDPLDVGRVTKALRRRAEQVLMTCLFGIQPDIGERFWKAPMLRDSGIHGRFLAFDIEGSPPGSMMMPDEDITAAGARWKRNLGRWEYRKRGIIGQPPIQIEFTPDAIAMLTSTHHPFEDAHPVHGSLHQTLHTRWQEQGARLALVLAMMKELGTGLPRVEAADVTAACQVVFRAHCDTIGIIHDDDRTRDEVERDQLMRHLRDTGGELHLIHGNCSDLSVARLTHLAEVFPEAFKIAPEHTGRPGQPRKMIRLC